MSYKKKADSDRDALFGSSAGPPSTTRKSGGAGSGPRYKQNASANRDALFGDAAAAAGVKSSSKKAGVTVATTTRTSQPASGGPNSRGYVPRSSTKSSSSSSSRPPTLSGEARIKALKDAEEYKQKATKAMESGIFTRPDPVAASTYYKRAADAYQRAGEYREELYYRISSGDCNMSVNAWASAASDYTRAAELTLLDATSTDTVDIEQRRRDASNLHKKAAEAWTQMNEKSKAAGSNVKAAIALNHGDDESGSSRMIGREALTGIEEAIEAHVPDVFNPYARYRQTGQSAFIDPNSEETVDNPSESTMTLARSHIVTQAYSHEPLQDLTRMLVQYGEYASALYAAGAATAVLQNEGISTISLGRAFLSETVLSLAMGDPVSAERNFMDRHLQNTPYLSSRECKLAEDLIRAVKIRDYDLLEETRSPSGSNRAALANLHESLRTLVSELRVTGVAQQKKKVTEEKVHETMPQSAIDEDEAPLEDLNKLMTGYEDDVAKGEGLDTAALQNELDELDFGDEGDNDDDLGDLDDDDVDLR